MAHQKVGSKPVCVNVSYTTTDGEKIEFKTPRYTRLQLGASNQKQNSIYDRGILANKSSNSLGVVTPEMHNLITAIRMADGKPNLTSADMKAFQDMAFNNPTPDKTLSTYVGKFSNNKVKPDITKGYFGNETAIGTVNPETRTHYQVYAGVPDGSRRMLLAPQIAYNK